MKRFSIWFRDWRRGYSDADIVSAHLKFTGAQRAGQITWMSCAEMRALCCPLHERRALVGE